MTPIKMYWFVFLFSFLVFSCSEPRKEVKEPQINVKEKEEPLWTDELDRFLRKYDLCIVITNNGCKGCNEGIVQIAEKYLKLGEKRFGIVLEASGAAFDISSLLKDEYKDRISQDFRAQLTKKYRGENSFLFFYRDGLEESQVERFEVTLKNMNELEPKLNEFLSQVQKNPQ